MALQYRSSITDVAIRLGGVGLLLLGWEAGRHLLGPGGPALTWAAIVFVCVTLGAVCVLLGRHAGDPVPLNDRWRQ